MGTSSACARVGSFVALYIIWLVSVFVSRFKFDRFVQFCIYLYPVRTLALQYESPVYSQSGQVWAGLSELRPVLNVTLRSYRVYITFINIFIYVNHILLRVFLWTRLSFCKRPSARSCAENLGHCAAGPIFHGQSLDDLVHKQKWRSKLALDL